MKYFILLMLVVSNTAAATATTSQSFRCGQRLVEIGDHKTDVLEKCGNPDYKDRRTEIDGSRFRYPRGTLEIDKFEEVVVDEWLYNFGPTKFKQLLLFENGILKEIRDLGYGY
ncbi:MAG: DUF2845 domain-containing protein [Gammaproteobacteria bacterium]